MDHNTPKQGIMKKLVISLCAVLYLCMNAFAASVGPGVTSEQALQMLVTSVKVV